MPTSQHHQIPKILDLIIAANPKSILDIGVGFGKFGVLAREYLELWDGREEYRHFLRRIDGIEAFKEYLTPLHDFIYNQVFVGDAAEIVPTLKTRYELVLFIDVLEHFEKSEGTKLLKMLLKKHRGVIVSVPRDIGDQGEVFGNVHEEHKAEWSKSDFKKLSPTLFLPDEMSTIVYLGSTTDIREMKKRLLRRRVQRRLFAAPTLAKFAHTVAKIGKKKRNA
jgi:hypothetical protein